MSKKNIPLEPEAQMAFACIISFFVVLFAFGIYGRYQNKKANANDMPPQAIRVTYVINKIDTVRAGSKIHLIQRTVKCDTIVSVPFKFYRVK